MSLHPVTAALALLLLLPSPAEAGEVRGRVAFRGPQPPASNVETDRDRGFCGTSVPDESLLVSNGGVENVVVRIEVPGARAEPRNIVLDQQGCRYRPRVQATAPGSTLELRNGDPVLHNVHGYVGAATAFNVPMPKPGGSTPRLLSRPGLIKIGCDVHAWMSAVVLVTPTPFVAVTGDGGQFTLSAVPPGSWQVVAWHERLGERRLVIEVPPSGAVDLKIEYP
jgi:plastocyanin